MNAAVAVATVRALASQIPVSEDTIRAGLSRVHWAGRLQLVTRPTGQKVLLDGAHNVGGAGILVAAVKEYFPQSKPTLVLGILRDKDWPAMCEILAPLAETHSAGAGPERAQRHAGGAGGSLPTRQSTGPGRSRIPPCAKRWRQTAGDSFVAIAGSLYLVGEAMELLHLSPAKAANERGLNEWRGDATGCSAMRG